MKTMVETLYERLNIETGRASRVRLQRRRVADDGEKAINGRVCLNSHTRREKHVSLKTWKKKVRKTSCGFFS